VDDAPEPTALPTYSGFPEEQETESTPSLAAAAPHGSEVMSSQEVMAASNVTTAMPEVADAPSTEPASFRNIPSAGAAAVADSKPPVVRFVLLALGVVLAASVIAFAVADDIARSALSVWIPLLVAAFVLPFLLYHAGKTRRTLKHLGIANQEVGRAATQLLKQSIVFAVLFTIIAFAVGYAIGTSGKETHQLLVDEDLYFEIGKRITEQRSSAANNVPAQIAMYDKLEPDVRDYATICATLHDELTVFDGKYPGQHQTTEASLHSIDNEAKLADLLLQEIAVARRIGSLDDAQQWTAWQSDMNPLLQQEDALN
jgi:hypothetical protein